MVKEIFFVTTNKHKVKEAKTILSRFNIDITQIDMEYPEDHDASMEIIAADASKKLANKLKKPIVVEDTGFFFEAYNNFPGALSKTIYLAIGYDGLFRLLKDKNRNAYAKVVVGYCKPGQQPLTFEGTLNGKITKEVFDKDKDIMPYERVFIPNGYKETMSKFTREEKNNISHRKKAFEKLAGYLIKEA